MEVPYPKRLVFKNDDCIAELKEIKTKDSKGVKLKEEQAIYIYVEGFKLGKELPLPLSQIDYMNKNHVLK